MKISIKIISFTLLIAFFGLLSMGIIIDKTADLNKHIGGIDCFGAGCGPVEHVVMHDYLVAKVVDDGENFEFYHQSFTDNDTIPQDYFIVPETPPPVPHI